MGLFDLKPSSGIDALSDPYSDKRMLTPHDRERVQDEYRLQLGREEGPEKFKSLTEAQIREQAIGKEGFSSTRISAHYAGRSDVPQMTPEEAKQKLDLSTPEGRAQALGGMRQNGNPMDPNGGMQCGASSLVGGALYGGGADGVKMLMNALIADRAKNKMTDQDPKQAWMDKDMTELMARLNKPGAELTQGDLQLVQSKTYAHFQAEKLAGKKNGDPNDPLNAGLSGKKLNDFIGRHEDIKKMFKDNDMGLDSIDLTGDGKGDHLVLGIGHDRSGGQATRSMIFDPQARQDKRNSGDYMDSATIEKLNQEERAKLQPEWDKIKDLEGPAYERAYDKLKEKQGQAVHQRQYAYKHDSQLITNSQELRDYRTATDYEANGNAKVNDLKAQTKAESPYAGMF